MANIRTQCAAVLAVLAMALAGCTSEGTKPGAPASTSPAASADPHAGHAHPTEGPHHGELIELGNEEYHAELLHDDSSVTIYVLNGAADKQFPIEATEVVINTTHDGKPEQFTLVAKPDVSDPAGKSSCFVSEDTGLVHHIDEEHASHRLALTINGKPYRGEISHHHDGHDHRGHDHAAH